MSPTGSRVPRYNDPARPAGFQLSRYRSRPRAAAPFTLRLPLLAAAQGQIDQDAPRLEREEGLGRGHEEAELLDLARFEARHHPGDAVFQERPARRVAHGLPKRPEPRFRVRELLLRQVERAF